MKNATSNFFSKFATTIADWSGRPVAFASAVALVIIWGASGPFFDYSETWQLVINTGTTIITFLMVFVLQNSQNRDGRALQAKLDELILTSQAQNKFVGIRKARRAPAARDERATSGKGRVRRSHGGREGREFRTIKVVNSDPGSGPSTRPCRYLGTGLWLPTPLEPIGRRPPLKYVDVSFLKMLHHQQNR